MIRVLVIALLMSSAVYADKSFSAGAGGTWDCTDDPVVVITGANAHYAITGACRSISVAGGHNALTIAKVGTLDVTGRANTIEVDAVDAIDVNGAGNTITWRGSKPKITQLGQDNAIKQGS